MTSPPTRTTPARSFGIADGLILVAALAAGLGASRGVDPTSNTEMLWRQISSEFLEHPSLGLVADVLYEIGSVLVVPGLGALTLACLAMRVRGPRPGRRRLARQPGFLACLVATPVIALTTIVVLPVRAWTDPISIHLMQRVIEAITSGATQAGAAVGCCWATLALCGRWAPEPTWIDRLGRALGGAWILLAILYGSINVWIWLS